MLFERITDPSHPMYEEALKLYQISFPSHEQREAFSQKEILKDNAYHFELIFDNNVFVGLVLYWEMSNYIYIEHFCIAPEMRNRQYGQKILAFLQEKGKIVLLEIDPPVEDISVRRKGFYERCGFVENDYEHVHPPYHKGNEGHKLVIMSSPETVSETIYEEFREYLQKHIMKDVYR